MPKIKFVISGEFPSEDVLAYAKARGYQEMLFNEVNQDGQIEQIPNPQSAESFVSQFIKNILVREVAGVSEAKLRAEYEAQLNARIGGLHNSVQGVISVKPLVA